MQYSETVEALQAEIDGHENDTQFLREQFEAMQEEVKGVQVRTPFSQAPNVRQDYL